MLKERTFFLNTSQVTRLGWTQGCVLLLDFLLLFCIPKVWDCQSSIDGGGDAASVIQSCTFPCVAALQERWMR